MTVIERSAPLASSVGRLDTCSVHPRALV